VADHAREAWGAFIAPQENLAVGVSETRTCPGRGLDMSGHPLWKPAWEPDMSGPCHTPVLGNRTEASIRVPRMFKSHVRPNKMVNRYNISLNYKLESLQNDPWVQKKYYRVARKSKHRCVFHRHNRRRGRPSLYLLAPAGTLGWTLVFCST
jgi:hypothetical protein